MFSPPQMALLPDGKRLHLNQGPIDLIVQAFGESGEVGKSYEQAMGIFPDILTDLVKELLRLRQPYDKNWQPAGSVAASMQEAITPHKNSFVTPMAAVAGAVADYVLAALIKDRKLNKAYVNNGGDIAFHLTPGQSLTAGLVADYHLPNIDGQCELDHEMPVRGIATSGWKGRSFSLGIADSVTVLAENAAKADVAATLIANAVDVDDPAIAREPASALDPDSDLRDRLVTVGVDALTSPTIDLALDEGQKSAVVSSD